MTSNDKAKALAAISMLADVSDADLMKTYLDYFSQTLSQLQLSIDLLRDATEVPASSTSSILNETVRLLQAAILDAHVLFFREVNLSVLGEEIRAHGLISISKGVILQHVIAALTARIDINVRDLFGLDSYFQRSSAQLAKLKEMFNLWLMDTLPTIHRICDEVLNLTTSASEVALLQQVIWRRSCYVDEDSDRGKDKQKFWEEASKEFLSQLKKLRQSAGFQEANIKGGTLLWNSVFKAPFIKQVIFTSRMIPLISKDGATIGGSLRRSSTKSENQSISRDFGGGTSRKSLYIRGITSIFPSEDRARHFGSCLYGR